MLELAQAIAPYVFGGAGAIAIWSAVGAIGTQLQTIQSLLAEANQIAWMTAKEAAEANRLAKEAHDAPSLAFEYVTCGGCGESVKTGLDGFTPSPHNCQYEKYKIHSD